MEMGIVSSYELRTVDRVWFLSRGDYGLTFAYLATSPGISIGRTVIKTETNADDKVLRSRAALMDNKLISLSKLPSFLLTET